MIYLIGTLHAGLTPENELQAILEKCVPSQLFIEIAQKDMKVNALNKYPPEMQYAYAWAVKKGINIFGFDTGYSDLKSSITQLQETSFLEQDIKLLSTLQFTWKDLNDFNKRKQFILQSKIYAQDYTDYNLQNKRNKEMVETIKNRMDDSKTIVIVTGIGHMDYFIEHIPGIIFPDLEKTL